VSITTENDPVNHPSHYTSHPSGVETLEVTRQLGFSCGNAVKYVWRRADKGTPVQDLRKAAFYINDALHNSQLSMGVPAPAAHILEQVAAVEPDPLAAKFYVAVAEMRWLDAESVVQQMIDAIDPDE
jgi:hypothetical protein